MSKKLLSFLLSELQTARVVCKACGVIVELPLAKLTDGGRGFARKCVSCNADFDPAGNGAAIAKLAVALTDLQKLASLVDLEFVIPAAD